MCEHGKVTADPKREKGRRERKQSGAVCTEPSFGERMCMGEREGKKRKGPAATTFSLPVMKERCCAELEKIVPYCRCSALRTMMDGMEGGAEMRATCSWGGLLELAPTLVSETECNLMTIHGRPFCYALGAEGTTTD